MKLYLLRHGQTNYNSEKLVMGKQIDEPLNEIGIKQAMIVSGALGGNFDYILSSPQKRAFKTAEIISAVLGLNITTEEDLMERDYGTLSGKSWGDIAKITEGTLTYETLDEVLEFDFSKYSGESKEDVRSRIKRFVKHTKEMYEGKKILTVTHGDIIRVFYSLYKNELPKGMENCSLHVFEV